MKICYGNEPPVFVVFHKFCKQTDSTNFVNRQTDTQNDYHTLLPTLHGKDNELINVLRSMRCIYIKSKLCTIISIHLYKKETVSCNSHKLKKALERNILLRYIKFKNHHNE